ncbi:hypothetical protein AVEN_201876-1 [Araneus ventricosus]|uniref:Uncharacterized protein n=1 Tax=Araneus ventricosus TaxID=182803 RepID=A0A4Y2IXQ3_ARAVE|nr:hypothetical protein AVEN_201876-1 [Araneus ventricosus]
MYFLSIYKTQNGEIRVQLLQQGYLWREHFKTLQSRDDIFLLAPLKQGYFGRLRHELDSPNLRGHLPHPLTPCRNLPLRRTEMGCGGKDNWNPYRTYILSDLRTSPSLKRNQPL